MTLTAAQLSDLRADLGDETLPYAFTDDELQRLYTRTGEDYSKALRLAIRQLLANTAKFYDYAAGYTRQDQAKIFKNLMEMYKLVTGEVLGENQVIIIGIAEIPPAHKEEPDA